MSAPQRPIAAVLFDADGVIQRPPADTHERLARLIGGDEGARESCVADVFAAEAPALVGAADFAEALAPVLERWNAHCTAAAVLDIWLNIEVDRSVLAVIGQLRRAGVWCGLTTSQERWRARHMSEVLGYGELFDREFYSCDLGWAKPDPAYFGDVLRLGELAPGRTLFIDDRPQNVEAARAAGLQAAQFVLGEIGSGGVALRTLLAGFGL